MNIESKCNYGEKVAAQLLGLSVKTLQSWRHHSRGPNYLKLGRRILYSGDDLLAFIDKSRIRVDSL
jgi:hypothetical protein